MNFPRPQKVASHFDRMSFPRALRKWGKIANVVLRCRVSKGTIQLGKDGDTFAVVISRALLRVLLRCDFKCRFPVNWKTIVIDSAHPSPSFSENSFLFIFHLFLFSPFIPVRCFFFLSCGYLFGSSPLDKYFESKFRWPNSRDQLSGKIKGLIFVVCSLLKSIEGGIESLREAVYTETR